MAVPADPRLSDFEDPRFVTSFGWRIWRRANIGTVLASACVAVIAVFGAPTYLADSSTTTWEVGKVTASVTIPGWILAAILGRTVIHLVIRRAFLWIRQRREPTMREIRLVARIPQIGGVYVGTAWALLVPVMVFVTDRRIEASLSGATLEVAVVILAFGGLVAALATFVLAEQVVRPVLSRTLPADPAVWPRTLGVTARLVLLFVAVSGGPLVVIAFAMTRYSPSQRNVAAPALIAACLLFAALGLLVFGVAGFAITSPLERLRTNMRRVTEGDLNASVPSVETGEIGLLQAGFNQMVEGLRERERLRDVFGRYVGTDVARRALEIDFGQGGELCEATAMFVDIIGSTALAQRKQPDAVVDILNRFFDAVVRVVGTEGGFVNKFQGDGALCIFGAPTRVDDHAARALRAARALAHELAPLGADVAAAIGVSSGPVVAGNVGSIDRHEFTVIGDPVNEASRLTEEAKLSRSNVLASDRTIASAGEAARGWIRGEAIALRGRSQPTITYSPYD